MTRSASSLVDQPASTTPQPNYVGAAYFLLVSLYCFWQIFASPYRMSVFQIAPIYYMLLTLAIVYSPLLLIQFLSDLKTELSGKAKKNQNLYGPITWGVFLLMFIFMFIGGSLSNTAQEDQQELFGPVGLGFFAFSILLLFLSTYPFGEKFEGWKTKVKEWGERLFYYGALPGFIVFLALIGGTLLFMLIAGSEDLEAHSMRFAFYYLVFFILLYLIDSRYRKWKAGSSGLNATDAAKQKSFFPWQTHLFLPLILALLVHSPITELSKSISKAQTFHFVFAVAYLVLAYADYKGVWQEAHRKKEREKNQRAMP